MLVQVPELVEAHTHHIQKPSFLVIHFFHFIQSFLWPHDVHDVTIAPKRIDVCFCDFNETIWGRDAHSGNDVFMAFIIHEPKQMIVGRHTLSHHFANVAVHNRHAVEKVNFIPQSNRKRIHNRALRVLNAVTSHLGERSRKAVVIKAKADIRSNGAHTLRVRAFLLWVVKEIINLSIRASRAAASLDMGLGGFDLIKSNDKITIRYIDGGSG